MDKFDGSFKSGKGARGIYSAMAGTTDCRAPTAASKL